jgi:hypothetical protein
MFGMNYRFWPAVAAFTILVYSSTVSAQTITSWKVRNASPSGFESTKSLPVGTELRMQVISGTWPAGVVMEVVAGTQVGVVMEAAPRAWLAVETGAADIEAARTSTPDKRTRAKGIPEVAIASPMPTAARIRVKQLHTRITRFPQIQEKASRNKTGQTARLNTGR